MTEGGSTDESDEWKRRAEEASIEGSELNDILRLLADQQCRYVLYCFFERDADDLTYEEVVDYLAEHMPDADDIEDMKIRLHHSTLPKLKEAGLTDYDSRTETIRYEGEDEVDMVLAWLNEMEAESR